MKRFIIILLPAVLITLCTDSYSQIGVTGYTSYSIGVNTSPNRKISGEFKAFANRYFDNLDLELDLYYNFKSGDYHRFSLGCGINTSPFNEGEFIEAILLSFQLEVFPIQEFKRLSIIYELSPGLTGDNDILLRNMLGIRYSFAKKNSSN
jgi:hypothetical protein